MKTTTAADCIDVILKNCLTSKPLAVKFIRSFKYANLSAEEEALNRTEEWLNTEALAISPSTSEQNLVSRTGTVEPKRGPELSKDSYN